MNDNEIILESFASPAHSWYAMNDPVMGGKSYSSVSIQDGLGTFDGEVADVPFLRAPGFITMRGEGKYPDVSSCDSLRLVARASEAYSGYRISFGRKTSRESRHGSGFKADFELPVGSYMDNIVIPFKDFTVRWDEATGDAVVTCEENESYCPDIETLQDMETISVWGEGVGGKVHLEIESISALGCTADGVGRVATNTAASNDTNGSALLSPVPFIGVALAAFFGSFFFRRRSRKQNVERPESPTYTDYHLLLSAEP